MAERRPGDWSGVALLFCGASHMGKSWAAKSVLVPEYGAVYRQVDRMYTVGAADAGMLGSDRDKADAKAARRMARNRRWPDDAAREAFFASLDRQIREALAEGAQAGVPVVIEGGTLRREEEARLVVDAARDLHGERVRLVRATFQMPYERWLQNRVHRMLLSGVEQVALQALSVDRYRREVKDARPKPSPTLELDDRRLKTVADVHTMMEALRADGADGDAQRSQPKSSNSSRQRA